MAAQALHILLWLFSFTSFATAQTLNGSNITCSTTRQCQSYTINCDSGTDCVVTCSGDTSCRSANINAPLSANKLYVYCDYDGCSGTTITGPPNSELYIECRETRACSAITVYANQGTTHLDVLMTQNMTKGNEWHFPSPKIYCPVSQPPGSCSLRVSGLSSVAENNILQAIRIFAQNGFNDVSITCEGVESADECFDVSDPLNAPILLCGASYEYGCFTEPKTITDTSALDWDCNGDSQSTHDVLCAVNNGLSPGVYGSNFKCDHDNECTDFVFRCNDEKDCNLQCIFHYSCWKMTIYGPQNANLNVLCQSSSITGNNQRICAESNIYGPMNGVLNFVCDDTTATRLSWEAQNNCYAMHIDASVGSTHLNITLMTGTIGVYNMAESSIYCPEAVDSCEIHASGSAQNMLNGVKIYAQNAFYSLKMSCDYGVNISENCYSSKEPTLYCNSANCSLSLESAISNWQCSTGDSWIDICEATQVTQAYITSDPSTNPTFGPTFGPTFETLVGATLRPVFVNGTTINITLSINSGASIDDNTFQGTVVNVTLTVNGSISSKDIVDVLENILTVFLDMQGLNATLGTDIITMQGTVVVMIAIADVELDKDEMNTDLEIQITKDLVDAFDGKVKVKDITIDGDETSQNTREDGDADEDDPNWISKYTSNVLYLILFIAADIVLFMVCFVFIRTILIWKWHKQAIDNLSVNEAQENEIETKEERKEAPNDVIGVDLMHVKSTTRVDTDKSVSNSDNVSDTSDNNNTVEMQQCDHCDEKNKPKLRKRNAEESLYDVMPVANTATRPIEGNIGVGERDHECSSSHDSMYDAEGVKRISDVITSAGTHGNTTQR